MNAEESQQAAELLGHSLGHYQVLSLLGAGGMGQVYLAQDTRLGRKVALKLLPSTFTHDRERLRRFEREARLVSALNHANILTIYEIAIHSNAAGTLERCRQPTIRPVLTVCQIRPGAMR